MSYTDKLREIDRLQQEIQQHGKLSQELLNKINYKFRLEWNYTSNSMEGNSLTKQETRSVMIDVLTVERKPFRDVEEMKRHNEVITTIMKIGKGELNISEARIKEIHKGIIFEEDIELVKQVGIWKKQPNKLINYKGEEFNFVLPSDVPDRMHELINWLNTEKEKINRGEKRALHPIQLAFQFHINYLTIHPFYDGNGRTARIFTNLILISYGYPPVYIKETEKDAYYKYLADIQGYGGDTDLLFDFMAGLLIRSLKIVIDAITGKDIDEPDDWEKQLSLLKKQLSANSGVELERSEQLLQNLIEESILPFIGKLIQRLQAFDELFAKRQLWFGTKNGSVEVRNLEDIKALVNSPKRGYDISNSVAFTYEWHGFKKDGTNAFFENLKVVWDFQSFIYYFYLNHSDRNKAIKKTYHERFTEGEINNYIAECADFLLTDIMERININ